MGSSGAGATRGRRRGHTDAISIVEAAYDLTGDVREWLARLLELAAPRLDRGFGVAAAYYHLDEVLQESHTVSRNVDAGVMAALHAKTRETPDEARRLHARGLGFATATQSLGMRMREARLWGAQHLHRVGVHDVLALYVVDPTGHAVDVAAPLPDFRRPTRRETATWSRIAAHVGAGARLRQAIVGLPTGEDLSVGAEAIVSPSGVVQHAAPAAQGTGARESLRRAVRDIDRARSNARADEDAALDLWQGLVSGRWSLVDRFDTDGRRFIVARRNDPQVSDPRALTLRERQVLVYTSLGYPLKLIAYSLGVSVSTVSMQREGAMRKLGLETLADVVRLFAAAEVPPPTQDTG